MVINEETVIYGEFEFTVRTRKTYNIDNGGSDLVICEMSYNAWRK